MNTPLNDANVEKAAKVLAACFDYPWSEMPEQGKEEMRKHVRAVVAANTPESSAAQGAMTFQERVQPWMMECFGAEISADRMERNHRFFEEATELVQANGMTSSEAHQLVDYTFNRPIGELSQEVGGVKVTLAALCLASGVDMHLAGETELARINQPEIILKIRSKQAAKPHHSPLPEVAQPSDATAQPLTLINTVNSLGGFIGGFVGGHGRHPTEQEIWNGAVRSGIDRTKEAAQPSSVFLSNLHHAYAQTDGTYAFPNSREGDMLKRAKKEIEELRAQPRVDLTDEQICAALNAQGMTTHSAGYDMMDRETAPIMLKGTKAIIAAFRALANTAQGKTTEMYNCACGTGDEKCPNNDGVPLCALAAKKG